MPNLLFFRMTLPRLVASAIGRNAFQESLEYDASKVGGNWGT